MRTLTADQLGAFFREAKASGVFALLYYLELATGLRWGELLGLHWEDVDWTRKVLHIQRQVARIQGQVMEAPLKTKNACRTVPIGEEAIGVLKDQQGKVGVGSVYVFPSTKGAPSPRTVFRTYSAGC